LQQLRRREERKEDKFIPFPAVDKLPSFQNKNKELIKIIEGRIKTTESKIQKSKKKSLDLYVFLYVLNKRN